MKAYKVQSVVCCSDNELESILNDAADKLKDRDYEIISMMFIGNNSQMQRIYQIVTKKVEK